MKLSKFLLTNAITFFSTIVSMVLVISSEDKEVAIDNQLESGTKPAVLPSTVPIDRPDIIKHINESLIQHTKTNLFGVIFGPSGAGKTYLTRLICNLETTGVLYFEIVDPRFLPERLAHKIGMKLMENTTIIGVLREKIGVKVDFYRLPTNLSLALSYVLDTLAERGVFFRKNNNNRMPCLFIDGVEKLAREYPELLLNLIDLAKHYANNGMLRIIFISRESHIVPLLASTPSQIWQADTIEVVDIDGGNALHYLTQNGLPATLGERVVNFTGGRFALLNKAIEIYDKHEALNEDDIFQKIVNRLQVLCYGNKVYIYDHAERVLMNHFSSFDNSDFWPPWLHMISRFKISRKKSNVLISGLLELDILRYTSNGYATWHNKVVRNSVLERMNILLNLNLNDIDTLIKSQSAQETDIYTLKSQSAQETNMKHDTDTLKSQSAQETDMKHDTDTLKFQSAQETVGKPFSQHNGATNLPDHTADGTNHGEGTCKDLPAKSRIDHA